MSALASAEAVYEGELDALNKRTGWARLVYPDGTVYEGFFADGSFEGEGVLLLGAGGGRYAAHWSRGVEVPGTGALLFDDGLVFNPAQAAGAPPPGAGAGADAGSPAMRGWPYLSGHDRRLWLEHRAGVRANVHPPRSAARAQAGAGVVDGGGRDGEDLPDGALAAVAAMAATARAPPRETPPRETLRSPAAAGRA